MACFSLHDYNASRVLVLLSILSKKIISRPKRRYRRKKSTRLTGLHIRVGRCRFSVSFPDRPKEAGFARRTKLASGSISLTRNYRNGKGGRRRARQPIRRMMRSLWMPSETKEKADIQRSGIDAWKACRCRMHHFSSIAMLRLTSISAEFEYRLCKV